MNKIIRHIMVVMLIISAVSCKKFMERDTYDSISSDNFFESESDLELYANGFLQNMTPSATTIGYNDINADYCAVQIPTDLLRPDGNVSPGNQGGWTEGSWSNLRNINYFLNNMTKLKGKISDEVYNHYEGVGRFWRAWFYYDKVATFGAVPFYDQVIKSNDTEALNKPKDSREFVMDKILEDLDFASQNCSGADKYSAGGTAINKWVALAFKSRVCLFEGTYRTYHQVDPSTGQAWTNRDENIKKFLRAAISASEEIMQSGTFSLVNGNKETAYRSLFTSEKLNTTEIIWGRQFSKGLSTFHDLSWVYYSPTYGSKASLTKKFINTYLMKDGTPFTSKSNYKTITYSDEFTDRDLRLAQTVISPKYRMTRNGVNALYSPSWLTTRTGYQPIKWSIDDDADNILSRAASWNSLPILRYAEVLLNYAEAKAELGELGISEWARSITLLRNRAGVTSIYPTVADPYLKDYYKNTISDPLILEVRRERATELCLEMGLRWNDLMRWHMGDLLNSSDNPWTGIYIPDPGASYDFNGDGITDFAVSSSETVNTVPVSSSNANQTFSFNTDKNLVWNYQRVWAEYKYLKPIPTEAITRNPNLKQNYLWENK
ncbi:RagB/SusD family nutrient uptake outer membrane protein [Pedobacter sp. BS3]|uniref:RagB/SusD family nutrient uptake outer membrane protein n=1 Tax=Pedobacter sp. BS3 TaxID=2567937 RepID=UPI0011F051BE|nr:RagB/SusD family nutrient uptake outer membrane protein [Pedobacter sp. BS3]TZF83791.1 RagB/SusD family nutrient uptake outer membrane protein [Pedobacter sp. BS3]